MPLHPLPDGSAFQNLSMLFVNAGGRFVEPGRDLDTLSDGREILPDQLPDYLKRSIVLPPRVTDVFVWVHGWRTDAHGAYENAQRLFNGIVEGWRARATAYPLLAGFTPGFVAVHWDSMSSILPGGYRRIRDRAKALTDNGDAEFFLASLLGYLDGRNERSRGAGSKVLRARGGFYLHCLGHSFGGRFLTAAVRASATPESPRTLSLLAKMGAGTRRVLSAGSARGFEFTVDSMLIFQMAAPCKAFGPQLQLLLNEAPLRGPVVLTHSSHDRANCLWHRAGERGETAIGCSGTAEPEGNIGQVRLGDLDYSYTPNDFGTRIVNVDASWAYVGGGLRAEGAHGDFFYEESTHLVLSLADFVRSYD